MRIITIPQLAKAEIGTHLIAIMRMCREIEQRGVNIRQILQTYNYDLSNHVCNSEGGINQNWNPMIPNHKEESNWKMVDYSHSSRLEAFNKLSPMIEINDVFYRFPWKNDDYLEIGKDDYIKPQTAYELMDMFRQLIETELILPVTHEIFGKCYIYCESVSEDAPYIWYFISRAMIDQYLRLNDTSLHLKGMEISEKIRNEFVYE